MKIGMEERAGKQLLEWGRANPKFSPRAFAFAEAHDGVRSFIDVSLDHIKRLVS